MNEPQNLESVNPPNVEEKTLTFVTGGTGLVGAHLIDKLIEQGKSVRALYRKRIPEIKNKSKVVWIKGDILDITSLHEALQNVDHVYHCAGVVSYDPRQKEQMFATNIEGTANIVDVSIDAGVKKFCFVSSVAALNQKKSGGQVDEIMPWSHETSNSNYGKSKYLAEMEVWRGIGEGLNAVIVNPSIILGVGNWNEGSTKIFKTAFEEFPWYTEGETGFVDVLDVASVMIQLMDSNVCGERFIISAENRKYKDIFTSIANAFGKKPPYKKVSPLMASVVWKMEALKSMFTNHTSLLTKETAQSAQSIVRYDNSKLYKVLPFFQYTSISETITRVCSELLQRLNAEQS